MLCKECSDLVWFGDYSLHYCNKTKDIVTEHTECLLKGERAETMENEKVLEIVDRIEAAFRELVEVTGEDNISACILDGNFSLDSFRKENGQVVLSFFRTEANNE